MIIHECFAAADNEAAMLCSVKSLVVVPAGKRKGLVFSPDAPVLIV